MNHEGIPPADPPGRALPSDKYPIDRRGYPFTRKFFTDDTIIRGFIESMHDATNIKETGTPR